MELIHEPSLWGQPVLWILLVIVGVFLVIGWVAVVDRVWEVVVLLTVIALIVVVFAFVCAGASVVSGMKWQGSGTIGTVLPTSEGTTYVQLSGDTGIIQLDYLLDPDLTGTDVTIQCGKYAKGYYSDCELLSLG